MSTETKNRPQWVFDGCGINGSDEYRSRLATLTPLARNTGCGALMEAAPDLLDALQRLLRAFESDYEQHPFMKVETSWETNSQAILQAREAIAKAKGRA